MAQLAASLMAVVTPAGLGWVAVTDAYLRKAGADDKTAHTATTLTMIIMDSASRNCIIKPG